MLNSELLTLSFGCHFRATKNWHGGTQLGGIQVLCITPSEYVDMRCFTVEQINLLIYCTARQSCKIQVVSNNTVSHCA